MRLARSWKARWRSSGSFSCFMASISDSGDSIAVGLDSEMLCTWLSHEGVGAGLGLGKINQ